VKLQDDRLVAHRTVDAGKLELFHDDQVPLLDGEADAKEPE
jgi:hypothetical protein